MAVAYQVVDTITHIRDIVTHIDDAVTHIDFSSHTLPRCPEARMSAFQRNELDLLTSARLLGRIATVGSDGTPHVVPVGWSYNPDIDTIDVGGHDLANTKKYRDVARMGRAAIVIDEVLPPWRPRGIEVRGQAEALAGPPALIRIHPDRVRSWGLEPLAD